MSDLVVEIDQVTKSYDDLIAVDQISFTLQRGQTLGLIGPNGAGKTTLLRIISTLAKPDYGDVRILNQSVARHPQAVRRCLGFMPAEFGSPRNMTIGEYLDYFGCMFGISKPDRAQRIRDVCELTELLGREAIMVKGLSTGNRQRLLLAKTLLHDPELLILDEPASGLDPRARAELRTILKALSAMGKTIIISSHILPDIEDISNRIGILEAGRLVLDGDLQDLRLAHKAATRSIKLRVSPDDTARTKEAIRAMPSVVSCEQREQTLLVQVSDQGTNAILATLVAHDIPVIQFVVDETTLEEIFLRSTAGKVT